MPDRFPVPTAALAGEEPENNMGTQAEEPEAAEPNEALALAPLPPPFASTVATSANALASQTPPEEAAKPGAWARALVGGVTDALAGFGAAKEVPRGAGALYGVGAGAREVGAQRDARQERQDRLQERQDKLKQQRMVNDRQNAIAQATIAHENAATMHDQMLTSNLGYDIRQKNIANGKVALEPYTKAGAAVIQDGIDSDEAARLIKEKKLDPTQQHAFATGEKPLLDAQGKGKMDAAGNPITRPTYTVVGNVPEVTLDAATSKLISDNTAYKLPEGTKMSGIVYGTLVQQATSAETAAAAIDEQRKEAGLKGLETDQKLAAAKMLPDWNVALAKSRNDPFKALQYMETNPQMKAKYPGVGTQVQMLYGGPKEWEAMRHARTEEAQKAEELRQKELGKGDYIGDRNAVDPQAFLASLGTNEQAVVRQIGEGRAPLNNPGYLLARKPEIMGAVEKAFPGFDASKVKGYADTYHNYTAGKVSEQLTSAGTALEHLQELRQLNTLKSRIPGTADHQAYQNKVDTVASELARFYGNDTVPGIKSYRDTLDATFNRDAAITTQAKSMGDRLDNLEQTWINAAPSKAYQAPMPGISQAAKQARASMDADYAARQGSAAQPGTATVLMRAPNGQQKPVPLDQVDHFKKLGAVPVPVQ